ncbi:MAG: Trm112 family protein [Planctomycetota bacterium]|nr:Trm112 family protein [Planctomycetota bacterium]
MSSASPKIDPELLKIIVCPLTRSPLRLEGEELVATVGGLRYPIREGIPVLLVDEATLPQGVASLDEFKRKFAEQIPK